MRLLFCKSVKNADGAVLASRLHFRAVGHRDGFCLGSLGATRLGVGIAVIVIVEYMGVVLSHAQSNTAVVPATVVAV